MGQVVTNKSQTIANLLSNILHQNKTALFISQKRVALEVVIERMGGLKYFMLQLIENQKQVGKGEKSNFYARLQKFIDYAKDETTNNYLSPSLLPLIKTNTKEYWKTKYLNAKITQKEINQYDNIEKIISFQEKDMKELAIKLNIEPKKSFGIH